MSPADRADWNALAQAFGDADKIITPEDSALTRRCIRALHEFRLVRDGVDSYAGIGYGDSAVKRIEYLAIQDEIDKWRP